MLVRNLPDELGAEDVFHAFSEYGEVLQVGANGQGMTAEQVFPVGAGPQGAEGAGCSV